MRRFVLAISVGAILLLGWTGAASAKTPPFTMTLSTDAPAPGEDVTVEVTIDQTLPAEDLDGLLGLFPADALDENLRPLRPYGFTPIGLPRAEDGLYRGTFTAPDVPGDYVLVPFPNIVGNYPTTDIYPPPALLTVRVAGKAPVFLSIAGTAAVGAMGALIIRRRRQERTLGVTKSAAVRSLRREVGVGQAAPEGQEFALGPLGEDRPVGIQEIAQATGLSEEQVRTVVDDLVYRGALDAAGSHYLRR